MSYRQIARSCGHTEEVDVHFNNRAGSAAKERKLWGMSQQPCSACRAEENAKRSAEAAAHAVEEGLPALTGTSKQIAWAETIREKMIAQVKREMEEGQTPADPDVSSWLRSQVDASWWIVNDGRSLTFLIKEMMVQEAKREQERIAKAKHDEEQANYWAWMDATGVQIKEALGSGTWVVKVWQRDQDRRVYINDNTIVYYHTGNHNHRPGTLHVPAKHDQDKVLKLCQDLCKRWKQFRQTFEV